MKKLVFILIVLALCVALCSFPFVGAETATPNYKDSHTYHVLSNFVTANPIRNDRDTEKATAEYLQQQFNQIGGYQTTLQHIPYNVYSYETYNMIATLDSVGDDCIVIGAHYDSVGQGANDNASGITALILIAEQLAQQSSKLPFDVIFVAFGGEEQGLFGSYYFVEQYPALFRKSAETIRLMINMDSIANGDNLYVQCENQPTDLADFILQNKVGNSTLTEKPHAVGVYNIDMFGYGYFETIQGSDHTPFRVSNIPVANFFSGNFQLWDFVESVDGSKNTMNTPLDTLETLNGNRGAEFINKIETVAQTVVAVVTHGDFDAISINAVNQLVDNFFWYNPLWSKIIVAGVIVILIVLAVLHHRKLQKQSLLGTAEVKTTRVFDTPNAEDIFTFKK